MALQAPETAVRIDPTPAHSTNTETDTRPELPDNVVRLPQRRKFVDYLASTSPVPAEPAVEQHIQNQEFANARPKPHPATAHIENLVTFVSIASLEAVAGARSMAQLQRFVSAGVFEKLKRRAELLMRTNSPMSAKAQGNNGPSKRLPSRIAHILSVRVCHINDTVFEAVAIVKDLQRVRPLAMRVELHRNNWRVTHFEVG